MTIALRCHVDGRYVSALVSPGAGLEPITDNNEDVHPRRPRRARRRIAGTVAGALAVIAVTTSVAHAQVDEEAAQRAAREIAAAQQRADQAAGAWSEAESELETLQAQASALEQQRAALEGEVSTLRTAVEHAATERFMAAAGTPGIPILTGFQQPMDLLSAAELGRVASATSDDAFDRFAVSQRDLQRTTDDLAAKQAEVQRQRERFEQAAKTASAEVEHLTQVEQQRLADEKVRLALEAQRREEERRRAEQAAAEAAQRAAEEAQRAAEQQRASSVQQVSAGSAPAASMAAAGMLCPVQGSTAYTDTWGAPRPGHRHQGVDMMSSTGTPLVAVADGTVSFDKISNGALTVTLIADDGTRYWYGHLSSYAGSEGHVSAGQVIGYVGSTGTNVSHLHFEVHPGGGGAVDPTPYVRGAGC
jgi:murein DD-endopeptidase MepM/ murein hydrolase activator NlpD